MPRTKRGGNGESEGGRRMPRMKGEEENDNSDEGCRGVKKGKARQDRRKAFKREKGGRWKYTEDSENEKLMIVQDEG